MPLASKTRKPPAAGAAANLLEQRVLLAAAKRSFVVATEVQHQSFAFLAHRAVDGVGVDDWPRCTCQNRSGSSPAQLADRRAHERRRYPQTIRDVFIVGLMNRMSSV